MGARPRLHHAFKGRRGYAKLFLEGGREMAGVGIAQIGCHRHDGGIAVGQASSGFLHSFSLKQAIDAVVEQNAEASLNF